MAQALRESLVVLESWLKRLLVDKTEKPESPTATDECDLY
jgi:hypothetical protein